MRTFIAFFLLACPALAQSDNFEERPDNYEERQMKVYREAQEKYPALWAFKPTQDPDVLKSKVQPLDIQEWYGLQWQQNQQSHYFRLFSELGSPKVRPPVQVQERPSQQQPNLFGGGGLVTGSGLPQQQPQQQQQLKKPGFWERFASAAAITADTISQGYAQQAEQRAQANKDRYEELRLRKLERTVKRMEWKDKYGIDFGY